MRVRMGWSGETDPNIWQKLDVELEQEDLERIFREHDFPDGLHQRLPTKVCFALLRNEAEVLLLNKLTCMGYPLGKANARIAMLLETTDQIVNSIKEKLAPV